ncbi:hypothetical protein ACLQ9R_09580 [Bordetella hinzii]|uniref:hypothetical protein n=1 Tax=Bordetella hinzii TaxID=103855 RepID=UPI0039FD6630
MRAEDILPDHVDHLDIDGLAVRKGTVAAFLTNARAWGDRARDAGSRKAAEARLLASLPALQALGLFDVLVPRDPALRRLINAAQGQYEQMS